MDALEWPRELDAMLASAEHHVLLFENDEVRVLDVGLPPGERTAVHTHCWPAVLYYLSFSHCVRRLPDGTVAMDSRETVAPVAGSASWSPPLPPHTLENVGEGLLRIVSVEMKNGVSG